MRLLTKNLQQRLKVHPVDMLRIERQPFGLEPADKFRMRRAEPPDRGEQPQPAAACRHHQRRHRRCGGLWAFTLQIVHHQDAGLLRIIEGRIERGPHRGVFQMQRTGHGQRRSPSCRWRWWLAVRCRWRHITQGG